MGGLEGQAVEGEVAQGGVEAGKLGDGGLERGLGAEGEVAGMVAVELLAEVVAQNGEGEDELGLPVAWDRLGSLGQVAIEFGLGGVDAEVDFGPEASDSGHDGVKLVGGTRR